MTYDARGNLTALTRPNGAQLHYHYDGADRLVGISDALGNRIEYELDDGYDVHYLYDEPTASYGVGRLTGVSNASATTTYGYNARGQVQRVDRILDDRTFTTLYSYDAGGQLTGMILPSGRQVGYLHDAMGQVAAIEAQLDGQLWALAEDVRYRPFGPVESFDYANQPGRVHSMHQDRSGALSAKTRRRQACVLAARALQGPQKRSRCPRCAH